MSLIPTKELIKTPQDIKAYKIIRLDGDRYITPFMLSEVKFRELLIEDTFQKTVPIGGSISIGFHSFCTFEDAEKEWKDPYYSKECTEIVEVTIPKDSLVWEGLFNSNIDNIKCFCSDMLIYSDPRFDLLPSDHGRWCTGKLNGVTVRGVISYEDGNYNFLQNLIGHSECKENLGFRNSHAITPRIAKRYYEIKFLDAQLPCYPRDHGKKFTATIMGTTVNGEVYFKGDDLSFLQNEISGFNSHKNDKYKYSWDGVTEADIKIVEDFKFVDIPVFKVGDEFLYNGYPQKIILALGSDTYVLSNENGHPDVYFGEEMVRKHFKRVSL